ncbi:hypothetical protein [Erythrobacter sp.]|uniref:hypothetical protein n=1 Tax=Erythrobacter sp. TaxID=1042 RepID=UPI002EB25BBA|nr:hypothetical protein [Erythrobacter sp.]
MEAQTEQVEEDAATSAAYIGPAPGPQARPDDADAPAPSKVYHPDPITARDVAAARSRNTATQQLNRNVDDARDVAQVNATTTRSAELDQLAARDAARALAQLTSEERQVLLEAVEGTDICDQNPDIPALRALCAERIETRSADFATSPANTLSAEERLLGEGLDADRVSTLETAIRRLAGSNAQADDFANQAIASVALGTSVLAPPEATTGEPAEGEAELSAETQALIDAIVNQFGVNGGGR